jgi:hypothetical protein
MGDLVLILAGLLLVGAAVIGFISVGELCFKWLKEYAEKKLKNHEKHKVVFMDTEQVISDDLRKMVAKMNKIPMEELERKCEPQYIAVVVDENDKISEYEGVRADECDEDFKACLKRQKGKIIVRYEE